MGTQGASEEADRKHRRTGCLTAFGLWLVIGIPVLLFNAIGECIPSRDAAYDACVAEKHWIGWFSIFGSPLLFAAIGWAVYRLLRRRG